MALTASELRANIYKLIDQVLETGVPLEIKRKGKTVLIVPKNPPSKLKRLIRRDHYIKGDPEELIHLDWTGEWSP
jgi:antitoxin (DNA-binding transcriptional repressor) of toxin-antitoxin stability system